MSRFAKDAKEFLSDLGSATQNVPAEMAQWWHASHRWNRQTHFYVDEPGVTPSGGEMLTMTYTVDPDYRLWQLLGRVSDALLALILVLIVLMVVL